jgi:gluconokinase
LRVRAPRLQFIYIDLDQKQAIERVRARPEHLFPDSLVLSQFEALESPIGEPGVLAVPATLPPHSQVDVVMHWLKAPQTASN